MKERANDNKRTDCLETIEMLRNWPDQTVKIFTGQMIQKRRLELMGQECRKSQPVSSGGEPDPDYWKRLRRKMYEDLDAARVEAKMNLYYSQLRAQIPAK